MGPGATELARYRVATPRNDYPATIAAIVDLTTRLIHGSRAEATIGIAIPGSISPRTGLMQNANSTWLNCRPFDRDLEVALETPVRLANDANCFALSEAIDGAAENAHIVFGVILGTGCGGGLVVNGRVIDGAVLPENGVITRCPGPPPTNPPDLIAGAAAKGAWKPGFQAPA